MHPKGNGASGRTCVVGRSASTLTNSIKQSVAGEPATQVWTAPKADANSSRWYLSQRAMSRHFRRTEFMEYPKQSLRLDASELHHLGPLLGFVYDELAVVRGPGNGATPSSTSRALSLESVRLALISLLSLSTIAVGVFLGAETPYQLLAS